jgi:hypothetical protein
MILLGLSMASERCKYTIDLEEMIESKVDKLTRYEIIAVYNSGRTETFEGRLKINGELDKRALARAKKMRSYPNIKSVRVRKF